MRTEVTGDLFVFWKQTKYNIDFNQNQTKYDLDFKFGPVLDLNILALE